MKKLAVLLFFSLCTISCTKLYNDLNVSEVSVIEPTVIDGTLSFKSIRDLKDTWDYLSNLSIDERKKWEETHGFYSIKRRTEEGFIAIHKANIAESEEMLNKALADFADVIALKGDTYEQLFDNGPYDLVCNLRNIFIISKSVQRVNSPNMKYTH